MRALLVLCAILAVPAVALGEDQDDWGEAAAVEEEPRFTATVSFLRLFVRVLELQGEASIAPNLSVAATAGAALDEVALLLGAQGRYYVLGALSQGAYLSLEASYLTGPRRGVSWNSPGAGLDLGASFGGKSSRFGITIDGRVGLQAIVAGPDALTVGLLANAGVGYSF